MTGEIVLCQLFSRRAPPKCESLPDKPLSEKPAVTEPTGAAPSVGQGEGKLLSSPPSGLLVAVAVLVDVTSLRQSSLVIQSESKFQLWEERREK